MTEKAEDMQTVSKAAANDTRLEVMLALRARLAIDVDSNGTSSRDLAALSKRLMEVQDEIDAIRAKGGPGPAGAPATQGGDGLADAAATPPAPFPAT